MLARIESTPGVADAWISRDGAFVVVLPRPGADVAADVQEVLAEERQTVIALDGTNRETVLAMFDVDRRGWIRGAQNTRKLTRLEADIVAERIASRVAARPRPRWPAARPARGPPARRFFAAVARGEDARTDVVPEELTRLRPEVQAALLEAVALGFRPVEGEA